MMEPDEIYSMHVQSLTPHFQKTAFRFIPKASKLFTVALYIMGRNGSKAHTCPMKKGWPATLPQ